MLVELGNGHLIAQPCFRARWRHREVRVNRFHSLKSIDDRKINSGRRPARAATMLDWGNKRKPPPASRHFFLNPRLAGIGSRQGPASPRRSIRVMGYGVSWSKLQLLELKIRRAGLLPPLLSCYHHSTLTVIWSRFSILLPLRTPRSGFSSPFSAGLGLRESSRASHWDKHVPNPPF